MFNLVAIALSVLALLITLYGAVSQAALQRRSNQLPAYVDLLSDFRSVDFHDRYRFVTQRLPLEYEPELGLSELPDDVRRQVYDIVYYFQTFATLRLTGILDDEVVTLLRIRVIRVWEATAPFVLRERELMGTDGQYLLRTLEDCAHDAQRMSHDVLDQLMHRSRTQRTWHRRRSMLRRLVRRGRSTAVPLPPATTD
ncbi:DUF4760 domain-containing protein [Actinacidiphila rubida]|uniref:Uncharacterized protein n=1 Tax=Actinacidiphila rubida TaxID=310780 RepID=A0A1H8SD81_9ACTN|nr:hypothetical protein [Actinacidiphila rubida]SEO76632.1 hypothetical protein SAMN05216267_104120 [Actinacidiphila rubida]